MGTEAAEGMLEASTAMKRAARHAQRAASGEDARLEGTVRLSVTSSFVEAFLLAHLARFKREHPGIRVELKTSDTLVDLAPGDVDIARRFRPTGVSPEAGTRQGSVLGQTVGMIAIAVYAGRSYLASRGTPTRADRLAGHDVIVPTDAGHYMPGGACFATARERGNVVLQTEDMQSMGAAAGAGFGLCALPSFMALRNPELVRISPPKMVDSRDMWLMCPEDLRRVTRVRALRDFLSKFS